MPDKDTIKDDILVGAAAIAEFLGVDRRQVYAMREAQHPGVTNERGIGVVARKSVLRATFGIRGQSPIAAAGARE